MKRSGISHVEAIMSFVMFIGFLIFAFYFFNPFQSNRTLDTTLDYLIKETNDYASSEIISYSVFIKVPNDVAISLPVPFSNYNSLVEDSTGSVVDSYVDSQGYVNFKSPLDGYAIIRYNTHFINGITIFGLLLNNSQFEVSSSEEGHILSEAKFLELKNDYESDYNSLREDFNLPNRVDFGFTLYLPDKEITGNREIPLNVEVFSKSQRLELIDSDGQIVFADLIVKAW